MTSFASLNFDGHFSPPPLPLPSSGYLAKTVNVTFPVVQAKSAPRWQCLDYPFTIPMIAVHFHLDVLVQTKIALKSGKCLLAACCELIILDA